MASQAGPRRRSGGPAPPVDDTTLRLQQFDDFRRRHSRQNREIITDNINRKTAMRNLQDQIEELQAEVLLVRAENSRLHEQVKQMQGESARLKNDAAREALSSILLAVPALQQLKATLDTLVPAEPISRPAEPATDRAFMNPMATRPAASAAENMGLGVLDEMSEPSDSPRKRRDSTSPSPLKQFIAVRKSAYSSPKRSPKRTPPRKRRRQSGLLPPPGALDSDSSLSSPEPAPAELEPMPEEEAAAEVEVEVEEWDEGAAAMLKFRLERREEEEPRQPTRLGIKVKDIAAHLASIDIDRDAEVPAPSAEVDLGASASSRYSEPVEEEGGRSRRTRTSVSYKEPSLRKKMRKPDGVGVDDMLGGNGKRIIDTGVRRKSALPRSAAKIGLNDTEPLDLLSASSASSTTRAKSRSVTPRAVTPTSTTPPSSSPKSSPTSRTKRDALGELSSNDVQAAPPPTAAKVKRSSAVADPAAKAVETVQTKRAGRRSTAA